MKNIIEISQILFGTVNTILLIVTVIFTARSAKAAQASGNAAQLALSHTTTAADAAARSAIAAEGSLSQSQEHFAATHRPWLIITLTSGPATNVKARTVTGVDIVNDDGLVIYGKITNIGSFPANSVGASHRVLLIPSDNNYTPDELEAEIGSFAVAPDMWLTSGREVLSVTDYESIHAERTICILQVAVSYISPISGSRHITTLSSRLMAGSVYSEVAKGNFTGLTWRPIHNRMS